jgi:DNA-binding NtrC family response regulator
MSGEARLPRLVVVDDDELVRTWLCETLALEGYAVEAAADGAEALQRAEEFDPAVVLLDLRLPDEYGIDLVSKIHEIDRDIIVVIVTAFGDIETAVQAVKAGAYDYLEKPIDFEKLLIVVGKGLEKRLLRHQIAGLREQHRWRFENVEIVGRSVAIQDIAGVVDKVAPADSAAVLLEGESGTGKDLIARAIHARSGRRDQTFLEINCTALPEQLVESELFGHERGAFTDARARKKGLFELADGGTLFLDEMGDMPLGSQAKLLRFLEDAKFKRVGGIADIRVDVRIIAATNRDLAALVEQGMFRDDLYFRLKVVPILIPPLRERKEDIAPLANYFVDTLSLDLRREPAALSDSAVDVLESYSWPGNVRQLRNVLERVLILEDTAEIRPHHLPAEIRRPETRFASAGHVFELPPDGLSFVDVERDLIEQALERTEGNITRAAELLGLTRDTIRYRLEKHDISRSASEVDDI